MTELGTLVRVSRLYYELGETQARIAELLGVTRPQVSRLLKEAREQGVVEIRIVDELEVPSKSAEALRERFGLKAVHLAPTMDASVDVVRRRVGRLAAQVLRASVRDGMLVGIGDGSAVAATADALAPEPTQVDATVVPLCGGFWRSTGGQEPFRRIAQALGASVVGLHAPGLLADSATRDALWSHPGVRGVIELWDSLDIALFGIGGPAWTEAAVGAASLHEITTAGAVGEVLIAPFDLDGRFVAPSLRGRAIAFDARDLGHVPLAIGVASGEAKIEPILGALRARVMTALVTDVRTAEAVLARDRAAAA